MSELDWQNRLGPDFSQNLFKFYIDVVPKTTFLFSLISSICIRFLRSLIYDLLWLHPWSLWYLKISLKVFVIPPKIFYLLAWDSKHWEKNYPRNKSTVYGIFNDCIMTWYCEGDQAFPQKSDLTRRKFSLILTKPLTDCFSSNFAYSATKVRCMEIHAKFIGSARFSHNAFR